MAKRIHEYNNVIDNVKGSYRKRPPVTYGLLIGRDKNRL